jgi:putative SOS response-associated peptidase YedK
MCGRYTLRKPADELCEHFGLAEVPELSPRYNIAPSQPVLTVAAQPRRAQVVQWGLVPRWARDRAIGNRLINARAESLRDKPAFRDALARRRCLIPADGFYEWRREGRRKVPMHVRRRDGGVFAFAGLWERWRDPQGEPLLSCTIITTAPNDLVSAIHDRMPAILERSEYAAWLGEDEAVDVAALLRPHASADWEAIEVGRVVNDARVDGPECLRPAGGDLGPLFAIPR